MNNDNILNELDELFAIQDQLDIEQEASEAIDEIEYLEWEIDCCSRRLSELRAQKRDELQLQLL